MQLGAMLYVYKGEYGLPSIDFECLRALVSSVASHGGQHACFAHYRR